MSSNLAGAQFRFGNANPKDKLPPGTKFRAPLVLANVGISPSKAVVSVDYTVDGKTKNVEIADMILANGEAKEIDLDERLESLGVGGPVDGAGVAVTYDTVPGSVIGHLTSVDQTGRYSFDIPINDPFGDMFRTSGSYPWRIDGTHESHLYLKNMTSRSLYGMVVLRFAGGQYTLPRVHFDPYQTLAIDLRTLIADHQSKKDLDGHLLPSQLTSGKVLWFEEEGDSLIGRLEIYDHSGDMTSSFSCYYPCTCNPGWNSPSSNTGAWVFDNPIPLFSTGTVRTDQTRWDCNNSVLGTFDVSSSTTYTSSNTNILSVSGSTLFGNALGSALITGDVGSYDPYPTICPVPTRANPQKAVAVAAYAQISSTTLSPNTVNYLTSPTHVTVTVTIYHQDTSTFQTANVQLQVGSYSTTPLGIGVSYTPGTQTVNVLGPAGYVNATVDVCCPSAAGTVVILASLANAVSSPASSLTVKDPAPPTNGQASLTTTMN